MTSPRNATTKAGKRYYEWRDQRYWSVTTIISGGLPKPALLPWGIKMVAEGAADLANELPALIAYDREAAIQMLKVLPYAQRDRAADLGSSVHASIEALVLGKPTPEWPLPVQPRMQAFERFLAEYEPTFEAAEASVYHRAERYAGTLDAICVIDGRRLVFDVKSGKAIYPEVALQLAAYRYAQFVGLPDGSEAAMPVVDGAAALHLAEDGSYELLDVRSDEEVFTSFLYVREVFRWLEETSKSVLRGQLRRSSSEPEVALAREMA